MMLTETLFFKSLIAALLILSGAVYVFFNRIVRTKRPATYGSLLLGNTLVFLLLCSLVLCGIESYYCFYYDETIGNNRSKVSQRWFARYWRSNIQGLRDNIDYRFKKSEKVRRITFLGDSFTTGHGIKNVDDRFVNIIRKQNSEWEVHCFAMNGFASYNELNFLKEYIANGYEIDIVVLAYCYNDHEPVIPEMQAYYSKAAQSVPSYLRFLVKHSYAINTIYHHWERHQSVKVLDKTDHVSIMKQGYDGTPWRLQRIILKQIKQMVEMHNGTLAVVIFPLMHDLSPEIYDFGIMHTQLNRFWDQLGVSCLDLLPVLQMQTRQLVVNRYDDHPNEYTHSLAAESIQRFLSEIVLADQHHTSEH